jgi:hypothetical protein
MQLTEAPEGKSSLQIRLNEAEKRAQEAENTAQDAQVTLARTLLEAARVEAVVTARVKAEREAEIEALKAQLDAAQRVTAGSDAPLQEVRGTVPGCGAVLELRSPGPVGLEDQPVIEAIAVPRGNLWGPVGTTLLALVLSIAVASYSLTTQYMPDLVAGLSATAAELASSVGITDERPGKAVSAGARALPSAAHANWLLYMPVEPTSVAAYLGGAARPKNQLAIKNASTTNQ